MLNNPPSLECPASVSVKVDDDLASIDYNIIATDVEDGVPADVQCTLTSVTSSGEQVEEVTELPEGTFELEVGTHTLACWAYDSMRAGPADCTTIYTIVDDTPPKLHCPTTDPAPVFASSSEGGVVNFSVSATSNGEEVPVTCVNTDQNDLPVMSGDVFAIGKTHIVCTAEDDNGNTASCPFKVSPSPGG